MGKRPELAREGWRFPGRVLGTWTQRQRLSAGWGERQAEPRAGRASGRLLPGFQTGSSTGLPPRHDFIFSINRIFFSDDKDLDQKKGGGTSKMPSPRLRIVIQNTMLTESNISM